MFNSGSVAYCGDVRACDNAELHASNQFSTSFRPTHGIITMRRASRRMCAWIASASTTASSTISSSSTSSSALPPLATCQPHIERLVTHHAQRCMSGQADTAETMEFPGARVPFTSNLSFVGGQFAVAPPMACYRTLDSTGAVVEDAQVPYEIDEALALKMYNTMVQLQAADTIFYEAQRQVVHISTQSSPHSFHTGTFFLLHDQQRRGGNHGGQCRRPGPRGHRIYAIPRAGRISVPRLYAAADG